MLPSYLGQLFENFNWHLICFYRIKNVKLQKKIRKVVAFWRIVIEILCFRAIDQTGNIAESKKSLRRIGRNSRLKIAFKTTSDCWLCVAYNMFYRNSSNIGLVHITNVDRGSQNEEKEKEHNGRLIGFIGTNWNDEMFLGNERHDFFRRELMVKPIACVTDRDEQIKFVNDLM